MNLTQAAFPHVVHAAVKLMDKRTVALLCAVNPSTVERWVAGISVPHPTIQTNIIKHLAKLNFNKAIFPYVVRAGIALVGARSIGAQLEVAPLTVHQWANKTSLPLWRMQREVIRTLTRAPFGSKLRP